MARRRSLMIRRRRNPIQGTTLLYAGITSVVAYLVATGMEATGNVELDALTQAIKDHPVATAGVMGGMVLLYSVSPGSAR